MEKCGVYMCFSKENYLLDKILFHWDIAYHFHWGKVLNVFTSLIPHTESS